MKSTISGIMLKTGEHVEIEMVPDASIIEASAALAKCGERVVWRKNVGWTTTPVE